MLSLPTVSTSSFANLITSVCSQSKYCPTAAADVELAEKRIAEITVAAEVEVEKRLEAALSGQVGVTNGEINVGHAGKQRFCSANKSPPGLDHS